jgi:hypothetical protein
MSTPTMPRHTPPAVIVRVRHLCTKLRQQAAQALPTTEVASGRWVAMPGGVIELAGTGYQVRQSLAKTSGGQQITYLAYDPDGVLIAEHPYQLQTIKAFCENQAANAQEFKL